MVDLAQGVFAGNGLGTYSGEMLILGGLTIVFSAVEHSCIEGGIGCSPLARQLSIFFR